MLPEWFVLMRSWVDSGKGTTGITLPFLVGLLTLRGGQDGGPRQDMQALLDDIRCNPVPDHFVGVRLCGNIEAPVLSALRLEDSLVRKCEFRSDSGQVSLAFSPDAMSAFGGLDCSEVEGCIERLLAYALPYVEAKTYSRHRDSVSDHYSYGPLTAADIAFAKSAFVNASGC